MKTCILVAVSTFIWTLYLTFIFSWVENSITVYIYSPITLPTATFPSSQTIAIMPPSCIYISLTSESILYSLICLNLCISNSLSTFSFAMATAWTLGSMSKHPFGVSRYMNSHCEVSRLLENVKRWVAVLMKKQSEFSRGRSFKPVKTVGRPCW